MMKNRSLIVFTLFAFLLLFVLNPKEAMNLLFTILIIWGFIVVIFGLLLRKRTL